jgi:hypothetical protein
MFPHFLHRLFNPTVRKRGAGNVELAVLISFGTCQFSRVMFHLYEELDWQDKEGMPVIMDCSLVFAFLVYLAVSGICR